MVEFNFLLSILQDVYIDITKSHEIFRWKGSEINRNVKPVEMDDNSLIYQRNARNIDIPSDPVGDPENILDDRPFLTFRIRFVMLWLLQGTL
jgi:hypothetical protein